MPRDFRGGEMEEIELDEADDSAKALRGDVGRSSLELDTQQSNCSASSCSSNVSSDTFGSCSSSSSGSVVLDAPAGPFSALDLTSDERIFCFDEKNNCIVSIEVNGGKRTLFAVPTELHFEHFYWSHVVLMHRDVLLGLLKRHSTRTFYVVSFNLVSEKNAAVELARLKTKVRSEGYQVSCQKVKDEVYFGFCNRTAAAKVKKCRRSTSDLELVCQQISAHKRNTSMDSGVDVDTTLSSESATGVAEDDFDGRESEKRAETGLLQVKCTQQGSIQWRIFSLGKDRLDLSVSMPKLDVDHIMSSRFSAFSTKYMTRMPSSTLSDPFYHNGDAYFVDKSDPTQIFSARTYADPDRGIVAALQARLRSSASAPGASKRLKKVEVDASDGVPSTNDTVWSNFCVCNGAAYVCVQDVEGLLCSLWKLELVEEAGAESSGHRDFLFPDQPVEVYSTMNGHDQRRLSPRNSSLRGNYRTIIRIRSEGDFEDEADCPLQLSKQLSAPVEQRRHFGFPDKVIYAEECVKWTKVCDDVKLPGVKILENMALRVDAVKKLGCLRGVRTEATSSSQCFAVFPTSPESCLLSVCVN